MWLALGTLYLIGVFNTTVLLAYNKLWKIEFYALEPDAPEHAWTVICTFIGIGWPLAGAYVILKKVTLK